MTELLVGLAGAGFIVSLAALLAVLMNDYDDRHRDARSRNQAHQRRRGE